MLPLQAMPPVAPEALGRAAATSASAGPAAQDLQQLQFNWDPQQEPQQEPRASRSPAAERRRRRRVSVVDVEAVAPCRSSASSSHGQTDHELAMMLQMEEETRHGGRARIRNRPLGPAAAAAAQHAAAAAQLFGMLAGGGGGGGEGELFGMLAGGGGGEAGRWVYHVRPCAEPVDCHGCSRRISLGELEVRFHRDLGEAEPLPAHVGCIPLIPGLSRPWSGTGPRTGAVIRFAANVPAEDRGAVEAQFQELPLAPPPLSMFGSLPISALLAADGAADTESLLQPPSGHSGGGAASGSLRRRVLDRQGDFTPEDYEMLLELDADVRKRRRVSEGSQAMRRSLIDRFPETTVRRGAEVERCSICLEDMTPGSKVRTLPCLHFFHRKCIDKWLKQAGPPRCPVDQLSLEPSAEGTAEGTAEGGRGADAQAASAGDVIL